MLIFQGVGDYTMPLFFFFGGGGDSFISQLIRNPEAEPIRMTHGDNVTCGQYMLLRVCFFSGGKGSP